MKIGSLCSGYGGLDMAVAQHFDGEVVWFAENDKNCSKLLNHHWPDIPNFGDVKSIDWNNVPSCDIMCAGYPCQPFSIAGYRKGNTDERSIFEFIAEGIGVIRPRILILENVQGHLSLGGIDVIAKITSMGYHAKWGVVRASDTGTAHRRARWFCVATYSGSERYGPEQDHRVVGRVGGQTEIFNREAGTSWKESQHRVEKIKTVADTYDSGLQDVWSEFRLGEKSGEAFSKYEFGPYEPAVRRWAGVIGRKPPDPTDDRGIRPEFVEWLMGLPEGHVTGLGLAQSAELKILGNGVVPQQALLALQMLS